MKKALRLSTVVIAHDPDSTIHGALYGCSHPCLSRCGFGNCFWVNSCSKTTFIFYDSFNSDLILSLKFPSKLWVDGYDDHEYIPKKGVQSSVYM